MGKTSLHDQMKSLPIRSTFYLDCNALIRLSRSIRCSPEWFLVRAHTSHISLSQVLAKKIMTSDLWLNRTQEEGGIK